MIGRYNRVTNCMDYGYWVNNTGFRVMYSIPMWYLELEAA